MSTFPKGRLALALLLLCPLSFGCGGGNRSAVEGSVNFDGQPLESGTIAFVPIEGTQGPSSGGSISGGRYTVAADKGPFAGVYRVEIHAQRKSGRMITVHAGLKGLVETEETEEMIPPAYNKESTLRVEVQGGKNTHDFNLVSAGK
jgi:hypothetical protein